MLYIIWFQLLYARGDLVELLISSNIARYAEFRAVDRILTCIDNEMKVVPCSRADVFTNKNVTVLEKRLLMKILTNCMNNDDNENEFKGERARAFNFPMKFTHFFSFNWLQISATKHSEPIWNISD